MVRLVFLSCLVFGLAFGDDPVSEPVTTPVPEVSDFNKTTQYLQSVPEGSHISDLVSSGDRFEGGVYADTNGRYYLYNFEMNWIQAMELCYQLGKRPATFNSEKEYLHLAHLMRSANRYDLKSGFWTAGSNQGTPNKYFWLSTGIPVSYTRWARGEPNKLNNGDSVEHCIEMSAQNDYRMKDSYCNKLNYVVCEIKA